MTLPARARPVVAATVLAGLGSIAVATGVGWSAGPGPIDLFVLVTVLVAASWLRPLIIFRGVESESVQLDDGLLVVMLLLLRPGAPVLAFALALAIAQLARRRPWVKSVFNVGQLAVAAGAASLTFGLLSGPAGRLTPAALGAATVAAAVFFAVNTGCLAAILTATGASTPARTLREGQWLRLLLLGAGVVTGLGVALALSAYPWAMVGLPLPFLILRQVLAGHFLAVRDRARLRGLFEATVRIYESKGSADVGRRLEAEAARLLRGTAATLSATPPLSGEVGCSLVAEADPRWLVVTGRGRGEPFDDADHELLAALASVGAGALVNASLYRQVAREREQLAAIMGSLGEGVCAFDEHARVRYLNPAAEQLLGWSVADLDDAGVTSASLLGQFGAARLGVGVPVMLDSVQLTRRDGSTFPASVTCRPVRGAEQLGAVMAFRDITQRVALENELTQHAREDLLTGLPNRRLFFEQLARTLREGSQVCAVLSIDADRFKSINDGFGHAAGDRFLVTVAGRVAALVRRADTLARLGGDEFMILMSDVQPGDAECLAGRIVEALRLPISLGDGADVVASVSIGIAYGQSGCTADRLVHDADMAMYDAKRAGGGCFQRYDATVQRARCVEVMEVESGLRRALADDGIETHFQPLVSTRTGAVTGLEALVRWRDGAVLRLPGEFIGVAEESGLVVPLGHAVLATACAQASAWAAGAGTPADVHVNLSARQFHDPRLVAGIEEVLAATGLDPSLLCLEITESLAMRDLDDTVHTLGRLRGIGVRLALDDFGTGYSSLTYLRRFPVDVIKIDQSFVRDIASDQADAAIVGAVVELTRRLGITAVAEGVETGEQLDILRELGCPLVQGFYFAPALPAAAATGLLGAELPTTTGSTPSRRMLRPVPAPRQPDGRAAILNVG